ncbi:MFS transporter [Neisseria leonii]|uniref:MFS transporter n=1 Tax=Neisseria leonii TaxID=2995413 RepID=UPI00237AD5C3|nr:MFS transporter [Neisseria sp. 3986]MDD9326388.1 MFS transporter [Neisseria sp. 3986]
MRFPDLAFATSRRFAPLFATQFLGAFNDNLFKTALFVMISYHGLGADSILPPGQMLNLGALLFILPYFLFSAVSGQISTRFDKAKTAKAVKMLEIAIMLIAAYGFAVQSSFILLAMLFCMGTQSTLFGPLKYAVLPDYLRPNELMMGNSLIESGTFLAILSGQILGTLMAGAPVWLVGSLVVLVAVLGAAASLLMPSVAPKNPHQPIEADIVRSTRRLLRDTFAQRELGSAIIGISWFWLVGAVYTTQLPTFTQIHLGGNEHVFNLMLALFSVGIAAGSVSCSRFSRHTVKLPLVSLGALGLTVFGVWLVWLTRDLHFTDTVGLGGFLAQGFAYPVMLCIAGIGFFGGFFSVPLYTWLQTASSDAFRAHAVAANNIVNGLFMVAAAMASALLLWVSDSILLLYLLTALGNLPLILCLIKREPRFASR